MFPIALDLAAVPAALAGRGEAVFRRLELLQGHGVWPGVFAPEPSRDLAETAGERLLARLPSEADLGLFRILFVAGLPPEEASGLADAARHAGVLVNVEDQPALCDFHVPAIVRRGDLTITVATAGRSPAVARLLKRRLEAEFDAGWAERLAEAADWRRDWRAAGVAPAEITTRTEQRMHERGWL